MKVDNGLVSNTFKANKLLKKGAAMLTVTAGSLYAASKQDGVNSFDVINEYYRNEFEMRNKTYGIRGLSRFSPEVQLDFLNNAYDIKLYHNAFNKIVNAKNADKTPRFNGEDALMLFVESAENIEQHPELFKKILDRKNDDNKPRFSSADCVVLMNNAELLQNYPISFNMVLNFPNFSAKDCLKVILNVGDMVEARPELFDSLLERTEEITNRKDFIKEVYKLQRNFERKLMQERNMRLTEMRKKEDEKAQLAQEKKVKSQEEAKKRAAYRAEERALQKEKEMKIKQDKINFWNEQVGWVSAERIFEKVNKSMTEKTPLVLENGEVLPDDMVKKVAKHIKEHPAKAIEIINSRYNNLQPVFNEKECFNVLSELDSYFYVKANTNIRHLDDEGKPFFSPEQYKDLLKIRYDLRENRIGRFLRSGRRNYSAEEIVRIMKNNDVTCRGSLFETLAAEKNSQGQYKYTVQECIEYIKGRSN